MKDAAIKITSIAITAEELLRLSSQAVNRHPGERLDIIGLSCHTIGSVRLMLHYNTPDGSSHVTTINHVTERR